MDARTAAGEAGGVVGRVEGCDRGDEDVRVRAEVAVDAAFAPGFFLFLLSGDLGRRRRVEEGSGSFFELCEARGVRPGRR